MGAFVGLDDDKATFKLGTLIRTERGCWLLLLNSSEAPTGTLSRYPVICQLKPVFTQMQQLSFRKQQKATMLKCHTRKTTD